MSSNCGDEGITSAIAEFGELGLADEVVAAHNTSLVSFEDGINSMFRGVSPVVVELIALCSLTIMTQMLEKNERCVSRSVAKSAKKHGRIRLWI